MYNFVHVAGRNWIFMAYTLSIDSDYRFRINFWVIDDLQISFRMLFLSIQLLVR